MRCLVFLAILSAAGLSCSLGPRPAPRSQNHLFRDLQRIVKLREATGWEVDRLKLEKLLPDALASVCRAGPETRDGVLQWLDEQIRAKGGSAREKYHRSGQSLDAVSELLELERIRLALVAAMESAERDCAFWIHPSDDFSGRQLLDDRWLFSLGGGGKGSLTRQGGQQDVRAGGAGRLLFGRGFGESWLLMSGLELGGAASFPRNRDGSRDGLVLGIDLAAPIVVRYRLINSYLEFEAGYLANFSENGPGIDSGARVGLSVGAQAARQRWVLPGVAFGISVERTFPDEDEEHLWSIKLGLRIAIDVPL